MNLLHFRLFQANLNDAQYDDTQSTAKISSQELSDAMVKAMKRKLKD